MSKEDIQNAVEDVALRIVEELDYLNADEDPAKARFEALKDLESIRSSMAKTDTEAEAKRREYWTRERELDIRESELEFKREELKFKREELKSREKESELKLEEARVNSASARLDRLYDISWKAGVAIVQICAGLFVARKVMVFEETGSVTTTAGKNIISSMLKKIF